MLDLVAKSVSFIIKGGWVMLPIIICSVFSLAIIIERFLLFSHLKKFKKSKITDQIIEHLRKNKIKEVINLCEDNPYYLTNIIKAGIYRYGQSKDSVREAMENASLYEIPKLEKNLNFLSTLAHVSPLLGLLGTVVGLVKSFYVIEQKAGSVGMVNPSDIAGGIWEALLTTVAGLCVAIISYIAYNYFVHKVNLFILEAEKASTELLDHLLRKDSSR